MYERKVGKAYGRGCLVQLVAGAAGGILALAMLALVLWLIQGGRVEPRSPRLALALAVPFLALAVPLVIGVVVVWRRGRRLDAAFEPLGLDGRQWSGVLRSWHGEVGGRRLDAWFHKGPTLELYLSSSPGCRAIVHRGGPFIRALERRLGVAEALEPPPFELEGAAFYATDATWFRRLCERPEAAEAVAELMRETPRTAAAVSFGPESVRYLRRFLPVSEVTAENLAGWLGALDRLAAAVDAAGPAAEGATATRLERWARTDRGRIVRTSLAWIFGIGALLLIALYLFSFWNVGTP